MASIAHILRTVWLILALALVPIPCRATIIVYTITRDAIYVAADGRITKIDLDGHETYEDGCKIKQFGRIIVAYSGTLKDPMTKFDVWEVVNSARAKTVAEFAAKLKERLPRKLQASMEFNKNRVKPSFLLGDMIIADFEDGKPQVIRILFPNINGTIQGITKNEGREFANDLKLNPGMQSGPNPVGEYSAISIGDLAKLDCSISEAGALLNSEQQTRCCVKAYIKADPAHINEPISSVKLSTTGPSWREKGKCECQKD